MTSGRYRYKERVLDFCEMNRIVVCNTIFAHMDIWFPQLRDRLELDHQGIEEISHGRTYIVADVKSDEGSF